MIGIKEKLHPNDILIQKIANGYILSIQGNTLDRNDNIFKMSMGMGAAIAAGENPIMGLANVLNPVQKAIIESDIWSCYCPTLEDVMDKIKMFEKAPEVNNANQVQE